MRALFLMLLCACGVAEAAHEASFVNEGVIPAPIDEVWKVLPSSATPRRSRTSSPPASFPFKEAWKSTWTVLALTPTDGGTQLRTVSYGYGTDEESLAMRRFFEAGNQLSIETLRRHFGARAP